MALNPSSSVKRLPPKIWKTILSQGGPLGLCTHVGVSKERVACEKIFRLLKAHFTNATLRPRFSCSVKGEQETYYYSTILFLGENCLFVGICQFSCMAQLRFRSASTTGVHTRALVGDLERKWRHEFGDNGKPMRTNIGCYLSYSEGKHCSLFALSANDLQETQEVNRLFANSMCKGRIVVRAKYSSVGVVYWFDVECISFDT